MHLLDRALNLPEEKHSHGLRKLAAIEAARGSMEAAGAAITRATGVTDRKRQARGAGTPLRRGRGGVLPVPGGQSGAGRLAADPDLRREGHRDAARCAAPGHRESRGIRGEQARDPAVAREKHGRKRMAELACVYDAVPVPRTPEDVISMPAQKRRKKKAQAAEPRASKSRGNRRPGASG